MHLAARDFALHQPNLRGLAWLAETIPVVVPLLDAERAALITDELAFQQQVAASAAHAALPRGVIHADLFRDNVMFEGDTLTGLFDFYFAGIDTLAVRHRGLPERLVHRPRIGPPSTRRASAFVAAYDAVRRSRPPSCG
jgi:homoserine kinase type II